MKILKILKKILNFNKNKKNKNVKFVNGKGKCLKKFGIILKAENNCLQEYF